MPVGLELQSLYLENEIANEANNGFIINAMHTREGCYTYIKEIVDGNSIIVLSDEEQKALDRAMGKTENNE